MNNNYIKVNGGSSPAAFLEDFDGVWKPSAHAVNIAKTLRTLQPKGLMIEVGSGSGVQPIKALIDGAVDEAIAIDITEEAYKATHHNAKLNGVSQSITALQSDGFAKLPSGVKADVLVVNPCSAHDTENWNREEVRKVMLDKGLKDGRAHLKNGGYLVATSSSQLGLEQTANDLDKHWGQGNWKVFHQGVLPLSDAFNKNPLREQWERDGYLYTPKKGEKPVYDTAIFVAQKREIERV